MAYGKILSVEPDSIADELGLVKGDKIISINDAKLRDIIDLSFAFADEEIDLLIEHKDGQQEMYSFDKDYDEELGVEFESAVFDGIRRCANHCYFCFVDQVAPDMRESLNIKDDDYRLSFLYGNFITMTNMVDNDFKRIKQYHLSPLYVSVQCTNPELRRQMLRCRTAGNLMQQLDKLAEADVEYHTQIVLCRDLNDGEELERSIRDILARKPHAISMAIVPVGLTKFRTDCYPLKPFDKESAQRVIDQVEKWQRKERQETGRTFIYLGDEFYFLAGHRLPPAEVYDGFPQLDNGIGLARNFIEEFKDARDSFLFDEESEGLDAEANCDSTGLGSDGAINDNTSFNGDVVICDSKSIYSDDIPCASKNTDDITNDKKIKLMVVSGTAIAPLLKNLAEGLELANLEFQGVPVPNEHFGTSVNVSGLLTAKDIINTIKKIPDLDTYDGIMLPESCIRVGDNIFLDDVKLADFCAELPIRVETVAHGDDYYRALTDWENYTGLTGEEASYMWQSNAAYTK